MDTKAFVAGMGAATVIGMAAYYMMPSPRGQVPKNEEEQINESDDD